MIVPSSRALPPMATITLERVDEPGEWEVHGLRVHDLSGGLKALADEAHHQGG
mgnify:CR=1 FL=1